MADERRRGERRTDYVKPVLDDPLPTHDALIAGLASASINLSNTGQSLLTATDRLVSVLQTTRMQRAVAVALLVLNAVAAIAVVAGTVVLIGIGRDNRDNTTATRETAERIRSCTDPAGECAKRGQAATANAIVVLQKYTLIAVECGHEGSDARIEACVQRKALEQGLVK